MVIADFNFFQNASDYYLFIDEDRKILFANDSAKTFMKNLTFETFEELENILRLSNTYNFDETSAQLGDVSGTLVHISKSKVQETESKHEEPIEEHLELIKEMAKVGSWGYDIDSGEVYWSDQMFEMFPEDREK